MKDFLLVLFYLAIVAVNTAVVLSGIIWLAKRKDEKDGRKPNPEFTPPPTKRKHDYFMQAETDGVVRRWANRGAAFPKDITVCGKQYMLWSINAEPDADVAEYREIKTPTTGTNAIEPKEHKHDKHSCLRSPFCDLTREQVLDGLDRYIKDFHPNDLLDRVENEIRKRIKDGQRTGTQPIQSFIGEVRGGPGNEVMGTVTAKSAEELEEKLKALADRLDLAEKKPVTPERLKEAGFGVEPVNVFNPAEESAERSETDFINAKCGDCKHYANGLYGGYCILRNEPVNSHERRRCYFFKKYEAPVRTTHICKNCKHYLATEEGAATGLCGMKDEITFGNNYSACFEKREGKDRE